MTVRELVNRVETNLRLMGIKPVPGDGDILEFLNEENQRVARELRLPRRYVTDIDATEPFTMPTEAQPGSLVFAERTGEPNIRIRILTVAEANDLYPGWERNEHEGHTRFPHRLVIYDPGNISAPVYPIGFRAGETLRVTYQVRPKPLVLDNPDLDVTVATEGLEGVIPEYHALLYRMATYQIAMLAGDNTQVQKARMMYAEAIGELADAFSYARPDYQLPGASWAGRQ